MGRRGSKPEVVIATAKQIENRLPRSHRLGRPRGQLQHLAQSRQVRIRWASEVGFPPIDCGIADIHLRRDIPNPKLLLLASLAKMCSEADLA